MAPNKFEKYIKKSLQEREIRPSANAWDRISGQLEVSEKPKKKGYYWYAIAASLIGFLVVSVWYFNGEKSLDVPQTVVKDNQNNPIEQQQVPEVVLEENTTIEDNTGTETEKIVAPETAIQVAALPELEIPEKKSVVVAAEPNSRVEKVVIVPDASEGLIDLKIAEIAAQVDMLEKENRVVTNDEIDLLLLKAQQEIIENKIFRKDNSVDALALLSDVEDELDKSFRDEIFDALKNGLIKVRTAVADRNK